MLLNIQHVDINDTIFMSFSMWVSNPQFSSQSVTDKVLDGLSGISAVLSSLNLGDCPLHHFSVSTVVKLNSLSNLSMEGAVMSQEQARAFMTEMGKGTKIKKFDIGSDCILDAAYLYDNADDAINYDVLENVEPEIVAKALNNVEYLRYNKYSFKEEEEKFHDLTPDDFANMDPDVHLARFLEEMGERGTRLKMIEMEENNYYHVMPSVMAKAFNKLEYLELKTSPAISSEQIVAILQLMTTQTNVQNLKLVYEDISWLDPDFVARAVVKVEQVDMMCKMSKDHIKAILGQLDNNSSLKRLNLGGNDVSEIPEKVLENAVEILRKNGGKLLVNQK